MKKIKDWFEEKLGTLGVILCFAIGIVISALPLVMIGLPFWATFLILIVYEILKAIPIVNIFSIVALWTWGFIATINGKQDFFAILFYIVFALQIIRIVITFLPSLVDVFKRKE